MASVATSNAQKRRRRLGALPWIGPAIALIGAIVLFPAGYMVWTSTRNLNQYGLDRGNAGFGNFVNLFHKDGLATVLVNTVVWVVVVVGVTLVLSMALAQFLNKDFPGRRLIRLAILVPWAASVVMTTTIFYYMLDPNVGIANRLLVDIGLLDRGFGFTQQPTQAFVVAIVVAVFVSVPFTTYVLLAGLQAIPADVIEAAAVDGASPWQRYRLIILPQLRPAIAVATIINVINVFNSLPILRVITGSISGYRADTTTTLTFKLIQGYEIDTAAALSVVNFAVIIAVIGIYVLAVRPMDGIDR